ncbi:MAG: transcriptional repressor [bacterium]
MRSNPNRRNTLQRSVILEELCSTKRHPTAAELFAKVRSRLPRISLGTVYRNLEVLHQEGRIRKLDFSGAEARFDADMDPHDHIRCTRCGCVKDLPATSPPVELPRESAGFLIEGHRLEYYGLCPECRKTAARGPGESGGH